MKTPSKIMKYTVIIHLIRTSELSEFDVSEIQMYELSESKIELARTSVFRKNSLNSYVRISEFFIVKGFLNTMFSLASQNPMYHVFLQFVVY